MKRLRTFVVSLLLSFIPSHCADAYELKTHRALTASALARSILQPLPDALGLLDMLDLADPSKTLPNERGIMLPIADLIPESASKTAWTIRSRKRHACSITSLTHSAGSP